MPAAAEAGKTPRPIPIPHGPAGTNRRHSLGENRTEGIGKKFYQALEKLPGQCRLIFQMNRFGGMKYLEIAQELDLSLKTVESQMGKALKRLRTSLAEFLPLLIIFLWQL